MCSLARKGLFLADHYLTFSGLEDHIMNSLPTGPFGLDRQSPTSTAEQTTIISNLFGAPALPVEEPTDPQTESVNAPSINWTAVSDFKTAHSAIQSTLHNQTVPDDVSSSENTVIGPFLVLPPDLASMNGLPSLYGPIDSSLIPKTPPAVVCAYQHPY